MNYAQLGYILYIECFAEFVTLVVFPTLHKITEMEVEEKYSVSLLPLPICKDERVPRQGFSNRLYVRRNCSLFPDFVFKTCLSDWSGKRLSVKGTLFNRR